MTELVTKHLPFIAEASNGISALRELILELAIQGRLLKREVVEPSWQMLKLPDVAAYRIGKTPPSKEARHWDDAGIPWVSISDMEHFTVLTDTSRKVSKEMAPETFKYPPVPAGSLLMSFKLTVGKISVLGVDAYHNEAIISLQPKDGVLRDYLMRVLPSIAKAGKTKDALMGATLNSASLAELIIPLPPPEEQVRIVAKVDELMALCDRLEADQADAEAAHAQLVQALLDSLTQATDFRASWQRLSEHFHTLFTTEASIDALKQTVLQVAVKGKLVPQIATDLPAGDFLNHNKISSRKDPDLVGWSITELGALGSVLGGATPSKANASYWIGDIPWVSPKDMKRSIIDDAEDHVSSAALQESSLKAIPPKSILMVVRGMILAHSFPVAVTTRTVTINQDMKALVPPPEIADYVLMFLQASKSEMVALVDRSSHGTCKLISEKLWSFKICLPPVAEQARIVAKVDELMALCDQLKAGLAEFRQLHAQLATALVKQAVA